MTWTDLSRDHGHSGATFIHADDRILKIATNGSGRAEERVTLQGYYMRALKDTGCVARIIDVGTGWYTMERLWQRDWPLHDVLRAARHLWRRPERKLFECDSHGLSTIATIGDYACARDVELGSELCARMSKISLSNSPRVLSHGDLTRENIMCRGTTHRDELVFIDLIPPTGPHLPPLRAFDLGKLMQSMIGWETIEYGPSPPKVSWGPGELHTLRNEFDPDELKLAELFCVYHLIRALPYARSKAAVADLAKKLLDGGMGAFMQ